MLKFQTIVRVNHKENPFVQLSKATLWDERLSLRAAGLWARCMSRPNDWSFNISELADKCKEGRHSVEAALKELMEIGLVLRFDCFTRSNGRMKGRVVQYMILEEPVSEEDKAKYEEEFKKFYREGTFRGLGHRSLEDCQLPKTERKTEKEVFRVNEPAPPSMARSISNGEKSLFSHPKKKPYMGKAKYTDEQSAVLEWLKGLNLDTDDATLSWWARNYTLKRLQDVYRETMKKDRRSVGAYMHTLLKKDAIVPNDRIEENRQFAKQYKRDHSWENLDIYEKYGVIRGSFGDVELLFDMEPLDFIEYLMSKHDCQR